MNNNKHPLVSVIIPTHNRAHLLNRAIKSVLNQTFRNFEIIVVDDASTDNTTDVMHQFKDRRITFIHNKVNQGHVKTKNIAIKLAKGEYLAFLDDDDEYITQKLEKQIKIFQYNDSNLGVVYSNMWRIEEDGQKSLLQPLSFMPKDKLVYNEGLKFKFGGIGISSAMIRKECFKVSGLFDKDATRMDDFELFIRISKYFYFYHLKEPLVNYYRGSDNICSDFDISVKAKEYVIGKYFEDIAERIGKKHLANSYFNLAKIIYLRQRYDLNPRKYLINAFTLYPYSLKYIIAISVSSCSSGTFRNFLLKYSKIINNTFIGILMKKKKEG